MPVPARSADRLLPWAAAVFAVLCILGGLLGVRPLVLVFKPLTTLALIAWAWPRGAERPRQQRLVRGGLVLSLVGDVALMWPQGFLPGLIAFLLAHLAYLGAFTAPVRFAARPLCVVAYAAAAAVIGSLLWPSIPPALKWPVLAYMLCIAAMAAQAAVWWLAARGTANAALARHAAIGGLLFFASDTLLAFNRFHAPIALSPLWVLGTYWLAQGFIAASLAPRRASLRDSAPAAPHARAAG